MTIILGLDRITSLLLFLSLEVSTIEHSQAVDDRYLERKLYDALFHTALNRIQAEKNKKLIRYTSYDKVVKLFQSMQLPMSHISYMNDHQEISYAANIFINTLLHSKEATDLLKAYMRDFCKLPEKGSNEICQWLRTVKNRLRYDTNIISFSSVCQPPNNTQDTLTAYPQWNHGSSLMWQAYAPDMGAAIIFDLISADCSPENPLSKMNVILSPVAYLSEVALEKTIIKTLKKVFVEFSNCEKPSYEYCNQAITSAIVFAMASIKHPAFSDEDEWRLIFLDNDTTRGLSASQFVNNNFRPFIPLVANDDIGLSVKKHFIKVILAPFKGAEASSIKLSRIMEECGVENAKEKICISEIPLRTQEKNSNNILKA